MRNTFPKFVVFTLLVLMGGFYFNPSVVSAAASCDLTVSVNNATGNVTVSGTVNETRPGVDTSGTSASISDSALAGSDNANNGDSSFVEYTVHFNDGAYTAYLDGTAISYPNDPTPENNTCHTEKNFTVGSYDIISSAGTGCSISPLGTTTKPYGSSQSYSIYSLAGYEINTVRVDGALVGVPSPYTSLDYTFSNITADHTIVAECKLIPITGTLLPSPAPCSIPAGSDSCPVTLTWTTSPLTATAQIVDSLGTIFGTGASGSKTIAIFYTSSPKTFYLKNNSITLAQSTATASCDPSTSSWDSTTSTCKPIPAPKPDLTIRDPITPTTAIAGSSKTFSANIINISDVSTSGPITHLFQFDNDIDHNAVNATRTATSSDIIANGTVVVSTPYTFSLAGDRYARACADKRDALDTNGTIPESDEDNNCGPWTKITVAAGVVNGSCSTLHNNCSAGTSVDTTDTTSAFKWDCNSPNGGTNVSCSETKYINLKAATPPSSQSTATVGVPRTFTSVITNYGNIPTGASFPVIFQTSPTSNFSSGVNTYPTLPDMSTMSALNAGAGATATSPSITFSTAGTMYVQACADKSSAAGGGVITESNEGDNCSGPRAVSVTGTTAPDLTVTDPITPTTATAGASQTYSATIRNIGDASASGTINHLFQFDEDADHALVSDAVVTTSTTTIGINGSVPISAPYTFASSGTMYVRVCADNNADFDGTIAESNEGNNCHDDDSWTTVEVSAPPEQPAEEPDLVSGNVTPYNAIIDEPQTFSVIIKNEGGAQVPGGVIHIFQYDEDTNHTLGVINAEVTSTSAIPALGGSVKLTNAHTFSSLGTKYVRACADADESGPSEEEGAGMVDESDEGNNCSPQWTSVTVSLPPCEGPDCGPEGGAVDGGWSDWSYNGVINGCSATCTNEIGYQERTCTEPKPSGGGKPCEGDPIQACTGTQDCSANPVAKPGSCAAKHFFCTLGNTNSPRDPVSEPNKWTWVCAGVNGGADASCSEIKKLPSYIED